MAMPKQIQRDYSNYIKTTLLESDKKFEFFSLALTAMIEAPAEVQLSVAKRCIENAAAAYFDLNFCSNKEENKQIRRTFKKTLLQALTKNFDENKAAYLIGVYTRSHDYNMQSMENSIADFKKRGIRLGVIKDAADRYALLHRNVVNFITKFNIDPEEKITPHFKVNSLRYSVPMEAFRKTKSAIFLLSSVMFVGVTVFLLFAHQVITLGLDYLNNEQSKVTLPNLFMLTLLEGLALLIASGLFANAVINYTDKYFVKLLNQIMQELTDAIKVKLMPIHSHHEKPVYHFDLFALPSLASVPVYEKITSIHLTPEPRTTPKIKTRPAYVAPVHIEAAPVPEDKNTFSYHNITFHRVFNLNGKATSHFIGLDAAKLKLGDAQLKKIESILEEAPKIVAKKGKSGIVLVKNQQNLGNLGIFKIKDKGADLRIHTEKTTETVQRGDEALLLHTASIPIKHISKKNN
jgi:hypothetical protein